MIKERKNTRIRHYIRNYTWITAKKKSMGNQMEESQDSLVYEEKNSVISKEIIL